MSLELLTINTIYLVEQPVGVRDITKSIDKYRTVLNLLTDADGVQPRKT
jgi:hypothetical protein